MVLYVIPLHPVFYQHSCFTYVKHVYMSSLRLYVSSIQLYIISDLTQSYLLPLSTALLPVLQGHHEITDNQRKSSYNHLL